MASNYHEAQKARDNLLSRASEYSALKKYENALATIRKAGGVLRNHSINSSSDLFRAVYLAEQGAYKALFLQNLEESKKALIAEDFREAKIRKDNAIDYWTKIRQNDELRSAKGVRMMQLARQYIDHVEDWLESPEGYKSIESILREHELQVSQDASQQ